MEGLSARRREVHLSFAVLHGLLVLLMALFSVHSATRHAWLPLAIDATLLLGNLWLCVRNLLLAGGATGLEVFGVPKEGS